METFEKGQVWSYSTREHESDSRLTILKVEEYEELGIVIHISVDGLKMENVEEPSNPHNDISHMPFSEEAIKKSVRTLLDRVEVAEECEGYDIWKEAFENEDAGVFSLEVSETVEIMEDTLNTGEPTYDS